MEYGLKMGSDVRTQTNKQLNYTSDLSTLKFYKWGNAEFTTNGSGVGSVSIAHGLTYTPISRVFQKITPTWSSLADITLANGSANSFIEMKGRNLYNFGTSGGYTLTYTNSTYVVMSGSGLSNNTTYYFRYYILVDLSENFTGAVAPPGISEYGWKVSKLGIPVQTAKEYELVSSSNYKSVQFHENHILESTLTLPEMFASRGDSFVDEGVYVDFNHNLGYPPYYMGYWGNSPITSMNELPKDYYSDLIFVGDHTILESINCFCDSTKVRVYFYRSSRYYAGDVENFSATTISIKMIIFNENLLGLESP